MYEQNRVTNARVNNGSNRSRLRKKVHGTVRKSGHELVSSNGNSNFIFTAHCNIILELILFPANFIIQLSFQVTVWVVTCFQESTE